MVPRIAGLAAGFTVEGGRFHDHIHLVTGCGRFGFDAAPHKRQDRRIGHQCVITDKLRMNSAVVNRLVDIGNPFRAGAFPVFTAQFALLFHAGLETGFVDREPFGFHDIGGQVDRETEGVIQLEEHIARDDRSSAGPAVPPPLR